MKRKLMTMMWVLGMGFGLNALASEAETSARISRGYRSNGTAEATARYEGDIGVARTQTRTGDVSLARGLAVGVDDDGLSLSLSHAVGLGNGLGLASNFNLSIGRDGQVAVSRGTSLAAGREHVAVEAGGATTTRLGRTSAISTAAGRSDPRGFVRTSTNANHYGGRPAVRKARPFAWRQGR